MAGPFDVRVVIARRQFRMVLNDVRQRLTTELRRQINRGIYDKPEDTSPTGRKLWVRTNRLKNHEFVLLREMGDDRFELVIRNDMPYAEPRHEANKPGRRRINPYRTAHWRDDALANLQPWLDRRLRDALNEIHRPAGVVRSGGNP